MKFEHNPRCFPLDSEAKMVDGKRVYATPNGEFYPSITTVIGNNAKTVSYTHLTLPTKRIV